MNTAIVVFGNIMESLIIYNYWIHSLDRRFSREITNAVYFGASALLILQAGFLLDEKIVRAVIAHVVLLTLMAVLFTDKWPRKILIYLLYFFCTLAAEIVFREQPGRSQAKYRIAKHRRHRCL